MTRTRAASAVIAAFAWWSPVLLFGQVSMDLHSHSYCSDGLKSPEELVRLAKSAGVQYYALSDHDTVACLERARKEADRLNAAEPDPSKTMAFIPGIEVSAEDDSVHILGLNINPSDAEIAKLTQNAAVERVERLGKIVPKLNAMKCPLLDMHQPSGTEGVECIFDQKPCEIDAARDVLLPKWNRERAIDGLAEISADQLAAAGLTADGILAGIRGSVTRPDIARALKAKGYVRNNGEAFGCYIGDESPAGAPMKGPGFSDVIAAIHHAGGKAILAHPYTIFKFKKSWPVRYSGKDYPNFEFFARDLLAAGLDGFEVYRRETGTPEELAGYQKDVQRVERMAGAWRLFHPSSDILQTPGSDYHGYPPDPRHPERGEIGPSSLGGINLPAPEAERLLKALGRNPQGPVRSGSLGIDRGGRFLQAVQPPWQSWQSLPATSANW